MNDAEWTQTASADYSTSDSSKAGKGIRARSSGNRAYYSGRARGYVPVADVVDLGGHYVHRETRERLFPHGENGHGPIDYSK